LIIISKYGTIIKEHNLKNIAGIDLIALYFLAETAGLSMC
jgi:hypothetical protein